MYRIRKLVRFEASHRLMRSFSEKCQQVHGHSYVMEVIFQGKTLNEDGMLLDFGAMKICLNDIVEMMDHALVLNKQDGLTAIFPNAVIVPYNPTAEEMAHDFAFHIMSKICDLDNVDTIFVRLHETNSGWAEFELSREEFYKYVEENKK